MDELILCTTTTSFDFDYLSTLVTLVASVASVISMILMIISVIIMRITQKETSNATKDQMTRMNEQMDELAKQTKLANETNESARKTVQTVAENAEIIKKAIVQAKKNERYENLIEKITEHYCDLQNVAQDNIAALFARKIPTGNNGYDNQYVRLRGKIIMSLKMLEGKYSKTKEKESCESLSAEIKRIIDSIDYQKHNCSTKSELMTEISRDSADVFNNLYNLIIAE